MTLYEACEECGQCHYEGCGGSEFCDAATVEEEVTPQTTSGEYFNGEVGNYKLTEKGEAVYQKGFDSEPIPIDWLDSYEQMKSVLIAVATNDKVRDKLTKYDQALLGRLDHHANNFTVGVAGPPTPGKTGLKKKEFEVLANVISNLSTTKKNKSALALALVPVLRQTNELFDPYRFMEKSTS